MVGNLLIIGAFTWIILWSIYGLKLGTEHLPWLAQMKGLSKGSSLSEFWDMFDGFKVKSGAHAHATNFALIAFLVGLAMHLELIVFSSPVLLTLSIVMLLGIVLAGIGGLTRQVALMIPGNVLFLISLIICFIGLF